VKNPVEIFKIWQGGLVFYGGFIGALIATIIYLRWENMPFSRISDVLAPGLALSISIGRIGCFLNGCCYGKVTSTWIGVRYPSTGYPPPYFQQLRDAVIPEGASHSLPVIPTQIISTINLLTIFGIIMILRDKKPFEGFLFYLFLSLYGLQRFIIDFFRYYEGSATVLRVITLSQLISIILVVVSTGIIIYNLKKRINHGTSFPMG
jgi:phosphatidylglycerol:prolipoprotein diacylglycerol transferase